MVINQEIGRPRVVVGADAELKYSMGREMTTYVLKEEFDEFKEVVKTFLTILIKSSLPSLLRLGKDKPDEVFNTLQIQLEEFESSIQAEMASRLAQAVSFADFEQFKSSIRTEMANRLAPAITSGEFERFRTSLQADVAKLAEDAVTRSEFAEFRKVLRAVV